MARTLTHEQANELFSAYLDRELSGEDKQALDEHLSSCIPCRRELDELSQIVGAAHGMHKMSAPPDLVKGVTSRIEKRSRGLFFRRDKRRVPYEMFSLIMLGILVVVYVILAMAQPTILNLK